MWVSFDAVWAFALAALVSGAPVFLDVRESRGVSPEESAELVRLFGVALESKAGVVVSRDEREVERLVVRALGVPTRIRLFCERSSPSFAPRVAELDLPRARARWPGLVEGLVLELFPPSPLPTVSTEVATSPPVGAPGSARVLPHASPPPAIDPRLETAREVPRVEPPWGPVISAGAGLVAGAVGVGFGLSSRAARDEARTQPRTDAEFDALEDRAIHHGIAANVLFGAAALGVVGGVVWYLLE